MLMTVSSLRVPNSHSAPSSMPKLEPINHFPQENALVPGLKLLEGAPFTHFFSFHVAIAKIV